jgi:hypothetical protein
LLKVWTQHLRTSNGHGLTAGYGSRDPKPVTGEALTLTASKTAVAQYMDGLPTNERRRLEEEAISQATGLARARYDESLESGNITLTGLYQAAIVGAYVRGMRARNAMSLLEASNY